MLNKINPMKKTLFIFVIIFMLVSHPAISMLLPTDYTDAVISIELCDYEHKKCNPHATGFLVGYDSGQKGKDGETLYHYFLVTNRHVFDNLNSVDLKFNHHTLGYKYYTVNLKQGGKQIWKAHHDPTIDIAVLYLNIPHLKKDGAKYKYFLDDGEYIAYKDRFEELGISLGDDVFVLGFPLGLVESGKKYVIVKSGIIARLNEIILDNQKGFLIDSSIFPGNSGSPVIIKPTNVKLSDTKAARFPHIIGIISSYIPYIQTAYVPTPKGWEERVKFTENSGLALVVPMDYARDIALGYVKEIEQALKQKAMANK